MLSESSVVVITGGGNGIGRAMARLFAAEGATVVAADVDREALDQLSIEQPEVTAVHADVSTEEGAVKTVNSAPGPITVLCNNAGISDGSLLVDEVSLVDWTTCITVNLTSAYLMCHFVVPMMVERGGGCIINTASVAGLRGGRGGAAYVAAKHALVGLTLNIAATMGERGIRCNAICPGPVATSLRLIGPRSVEGSRRMQADPSLPARVDPERVAQVALMLAREEAGLVNGAAIPVDGGWIAY
jgi:NAD(P)-dependent dehydrogenase (short-subunit alcohol dehydrogenase family)